MFHLNCFAKAAVFTNFKLMNITKININIKLLYTNIKSYINYIIYQYYLKIGSVSNSNKKNLGLTG